PAAAERAARSPRCQWCSRPLLAGASVTGPAGADRVGHPGEDPGEVAQRLADPDTLAGHGELADGALVRAGAFLENRQRLAHLALGLEVTQQDDGVGEVADIDIAAHPA